MTHNYQAIAPFKPLLTIITQLGIGHLCLGRRTIDISGGELQRLRIANQLATKSLQHNLFILDEPAAGLHPIDVALLHETLNELVRQGNNSVIIIEHNLALIAQSDWVIEFGPECGAKGGKVIAQNTPEQLKKLDTPTAQAIRACNEPINKQQWNEQRLNTTPSLDSAKDDLSKIKALIGYDVLPSVTDNSDAPIAMIFDPATYTEHNVLEFGGFINEIISLALDIQKTDSSELLAAWQQNPQAQLFINPLLNDIAIWGENLPKSLITQYHKQSKLNDNCTSFNACEQRIKVPFSNTHATNTMALSQALDFGAGYVELRDNDKLLAYCATRPVDFEQHNVGPIKPLVTNYIRQNGNAQCPVCKGSGTVIELALPLLIGDDNQSIESNRFLNTDLLNVFKGIYRSELLPFFNRMIKEQLWPAQTPIAKLTDEQKQILLYGYWCRPSHGSFVKSAKHDANEVNAWLRWEGLIAHALANQAKADKAWQQQLAASQTQTTCFNCKGSGLNRHSQLLQLGDWDWQSWLAQGTLAQLYDTLNAIEATTARVQARKAQIETILQAIIDQGYGKLPLNTPLLNGPWRLIVETITKQLSTLALIIKEH